MNVTYLEILTLATEKAFQNWVEASEELEKDPINFKLMKKEYQQWEMYYAVFREYCKEFDKRKGGE